MKKIINVFALAAMLFVAACNPKPVSIIKEAKADYAEAVAEMPDSLVAFYEVEMVLDSPISNLQKDKEVRLSESLTVIQELDTVKFIDRAYGKKGNLLKKDINKVKGDWLGDMNMALDSLVLDLNDAMEALKKADIVLPEADKVTLRRPLAPPFEYLYIFGTYGTFFVAVNALTGEVKNLEATEEFVGIKKEEEVAE